MVVFLASSASFCLPTRTRTFRDIGGVTARHTPVPAGAPFGTTIARIAAVCSEFASRIQQMVHCAKNGDTPSRVGMKLSYIAPVAPLSIFTPVILSFKERSGGRS